MLDTTNIFVFFRDTHAFCVTASIIYKITENSWFLQFSFQIELEGIGLFYRKIRFISSVAEEGIFGAFSSTRRAVVMALSVWPLSWYILASR